MGYSGSCRKTGYYENKKGYELGITGRENDNGRDPPGYPRDKGQDQIDVPPTLPRKRFFPHFVKSIVKSDSADDNRQNNQKPGKDLSMKNDIAHHVGKNKGNDERGACLVGTCRIARRTCSLRMPSLKSLLVSVSFSIWLMASIFNHDSQRS